MNDNVIHKDCEYNDKIDPDISIEQKIVDEVYNNINTSEMQIPADDIYMPSEKVIVRRYKLKKV